MTRIVRSVIASRSASRSTRPSRPTPRHVTAKPSSSRLLAAVEDGLVLGGQRDDVVAACARARARTPLMREVVRLGGAAGEDDLLGARADQRGHLPTRALRRRRRPSSRTHASGWRRCRNAPRSTAASPPARAGPPACWRGNRDKSGISGPLHRFSSGDGQRLSGTSSARLSTMPWSLDILQLAPPRSHLRQYFGWLGSTWSTQARMPPLRFFTLLNPCSRRNAAARALRMPDLHCATISRLASSSREPLRQLAQRDQRSSPGCG